VQGNREDIFPEVFKEAPDKYPADGISQTPHAESEFNN